MEISKVIALAAIGISVVSLGSVIASNSSLKSNIIELTNKTAVQTQTINSLVTELNSSKHAIENDEMTITQLQNNTSYLTNQIQSLDNRITSLEQRIQTPQCTFTEGCPSPSYLQGTPQPPKLVGWWPADGNASDVTGGHNGILSSGVTFGPGVIGQAFIFDGVNGSVNVGSLSINNTNAPFTIVARVNPDGATINDGTEHSFVQEGSGINGYGNGEYFVDLSLDSEYGPGTIMFRIGSGQSFAVTETTPGLSGNKWTFVAATYDGSKTLNGMKIYLDGLLQNGQFAPASTLQGTAIPRDQWAIGAQPSGANHFYFFKGSIDDVKVFSCALSQSDIQEEFLKHDVMKCPSSHS